MSDSWTDGKGRTLINFLINSPAGTFFLKSVDASDAVKNGDLLFTYLDAVIEEVGAENVVQIITDNGSNYVSAGKKLMEKRKHIYWTPCAAHCIDLMLEDIGKLKIHESTLAKAKHVVKFIYGHTWVLSLMRSFTKDRELIRPAITRFATAFLTLQSIYKQKQPLQAMFSSESWCSSQWAKKTEGIKSRATILFDPHFWGQLAYCIKSVIPLVNVLREVDSEERPAMGYIYELMDSAKEKIAFNCGQNERKYAPVWKKIDERWNVQLHKPLHAACYYLNPQFRFEASFSNDAEVKQGLIECMERMLEYEDRLKADIQLDVYENLRCEFGSRVALDSRKLRSPADWWTRFGGKTPELTAFAIRVLSLTCCSSGCERNWSTFESIHTKKRNRLEHKRLNALVYVKYNTRLRERSIRRKQNFDPLLVNDIDSDDEWIVEKEDPVLPQEPTWLNGEDELFDVDVIRNVSVNSTNEDEPQIQSSTNNIFMTYSHRKRKLDENSTAALPWRPKINVYLRAHILFERSEERKWEPEELELLKRYYAEHGPKWRNLADILGKSRIHVKDAWRRIKLPNRKKGRWSQDEYQSLFDLVNLDMRMKAFEEKKSNHCLLKDNISWEAISNKLSTRGSPTCCLKWYHHLASSMAKEGNWCTLDDYKLIEALQKADACCFEDVDWDNLLAHRSAKFCQKRWHEMIRHLDNFWAMPFIELVDLLSARYRPDMIEYREMDQNKNHVS